MVTFEERIAALTDRLSVINCATRFTVLEVLADTGLTMPIERPAMAIDWNDHFDKFGDTFDKFGDYPPPWHHPEDDDRPCAARADTTAQSRHKPGTNVRPQPVPA